jgi:D-alanyl-D-alanine carboxypeptidase (penicillin-binding protein 5/6)
MTALLALEYFENRLDTVVTVPAAALRGMEKGSAVLNLKENEEITVLDLIHATLIAGMNDAANTLAVGAGRLIAEDDSLPAADAIKAFMKEMNRTAKAYGMSDSHFTTPDGYHDPEHYTTMEDLATLGLLILDMPEVLKYTNLPSDQIALDETRILDWKNTNALIHPESEFYCSAAVGLKTGQHSAAGKCLLSAFRFNGKTVLIGVFGCADDPERFADTLQLLQLCT